MNCLRSTCIRCTRWDYFDVFRILVQQFGKTGRPYFNISESFCLVAWLLSLATFRILIHSFMKNWWREWKLLPCLSKGFSNISVLKSHVNPGMYTASIHSSLTRGGLRMNEHFKNCVIRKQCRSTMKYYTKVGTVCCWIACALDWEVYTWHWLWQLKSCRSKLYELL